MVDQRRNSEGYLDLTAYDAIKNIEGDVRDRSDLDCYVKKKIALLTNDFLCTPTEEEVAGLMKQKSVDDIDRYARYILKCHWDAEDKEE